MLEHGAAKVVWVGVRSDDTKEGEEKCKAQSDNIKNGAERGTKFTPGPQRGF